MRVIIHGWAVVILLQIAGAGMALAGQLVQVKISNLAFQPAEISVQDGDTVEWAKDDFIEHTATANNGGWDVIPGVGHVGRVQFDQPGTFDYFCAYHPNMTGSIHVSAN